LLGALKTVQIKKKRKRGFFILYERGLAALTLIARRFENQQKKHQQHPK
jgi:hypothetical protein